MTDKTYYVTELTIRVLAEGEPWDGDLQWLSHDVTVGDYVGHVVSEGTMPVPPERMAQMLEEAGSDPGFFNLDDDDEDLTPA